jgi:maltose alpha-D-glucosyltransferase/alpha-amylase
MPLGARRGSSRPNAGLEAVLARALARALPGFLARCRWFGDKGRVIRGARVVGAWSLPSGSRRASPHHVSLDLVRVTFAHGEPGTYVMATALATGARARHIRAQRPDAVIADLCAAKPASALLFDATTDRSFWRRLIRWLASGRRLEGARGTLEPTLLPAFGALRGSRTMTLEPGLGQPDQSNTSVTYGDRLILKLFRRVDAGVSPEVEMSGLLTERGFTHTPALGGYLEYHPTRGAPVTLAALHQYVPNSGDAWRRARQEVAGFFARLATGAMARGRGHGRPRIGTGTNGAGAGSLAAAPDAVGPYLAAIELLGRRIAEMHLTLAAGTDDPAFAPARYTPRVQRAEGRAMRELARHAADLVRARLPHMRGEARAAASRFLRAEPRILARMAAFVDRPLSVARIRGHGDLHLGQVLHTGSDYSIIDFEGEPARPLVERRRKTAALRDVAGMLRSFHYAAFSTLEEQLASGAVRGEERPTMERWADGWQAHVGGAFLRGYLVTAGRSLALVPRDEDELRLLLDVFQLEKAVYEVAYEVNHRPAWLPIPLRAVAGLA